MYQVNGSTDRNTHLPFHRKKRHYNNGQVNQNIWVAIFDLDGVLVNTARYHYLAWKRLAVELGFDFTEQENERLKGVSRDQALEIL